jgi:peroxiredoxin
MMRYQNPHEKKKTNWTAVYVLIGITVIVGLLLAYRALRPETAESSSQPVSYIEYGSRRIPSVVPAAVDFPAPELELTDLEGEPVSLAGLNGQVVLVNQWAVFCPFCEAEMPEFEDYLEAHQEQGFTLVAVNVGDKADEVLAYVEKKDLTVPVWLDPKSQIFRAFQSNHLPSSYVIDRRGQVRLAWNGPVSLEMLEAHVTPLLKE